MERVGHIMERISVSTLGRERVRRGARKRQHFSRGHGLSERKQIRLGIHPNGDQLTQPSIDQVHCNENEPSIGSMIPLRCFLQELSSVIQMNMSHVSDWVSTRHQHQTARDTSPRKQPARTGHKLSDRGGWAQEKDGWDRTTVSGISLRV